MRRKVIAIGTAMVAAAAVGAGCYWPFVHGEKALRLPGTVEVQEVRPGSRVGGRVKQVAVREGELVPAGGTLVVFEAPGLEAQRDQVVQRLAAARAALAKARTGPRAEEKRAAWAAVRAAEARWQRLKAGPRAEEIEQARGELEASEAERERRGRDWQRQKALVSGVLAEADRDDTRFAYLRSGGLARAARARVDLLDAGSRAEEIAEAEAELARVKAQAELLDAGTRAEEVAEAEARVGELEARLRELEAELLEAVVRAAEPAVVEVVSIRPGDMVAANQPVARLLRAEDLWVKAYVSEIDLGRVRLGQAVQVTVDSYADRRFQGTVTYVATASEFTPRNVQSVDERRHQVFGLRVRVTDPQGVFKSGMAAEVILPLQ
jgi:multidrug resistance efflux pump